MNRKLISFDYSTMSIADGLVEQTEVTALKGSSGNP